MIPAAKHGLLGGHRMLSQKSDGLHKHCCLPKSCNHLFPKDGEIVIEHEQDISYNMLGLEEAKAVYLVMDSDRLFMSFPLHFRVSKNYP